MSTISCSKDFEITINPSSTCPTLVATILLPEVQYGYPGFGNGYIFQGCLNSVQFIRVSDNGIAGSLVTGAIARQSVYSPTQDKVFTGLANGTIQVIDGTALVGLAVIDPGPSNGELIVYNSDDDKIYVQYVDMPVFDDILYTARYSCLDYSQIASDVCTIGLLTDFTQGWVAPAPTHGTVVHSYSITATNQKVIQVLDYANLNAAPIATNTLPYPDYFIVKNGVYNAAAGQIWALAVRIGGGIPPDIYNVVLLKIDPDDGSILDEVSLYWNDWFIADFVLLPGVNLFAIHYQQAGSRYVAFYDATTEALICTFPPDVAFNSMCEEPTGDIYLGDVYNIPAVNLRRYST